MTSSALSLHHLTIADLSVPDFLRLAGKGDCSAVTLFTNNLGYDFPMVADDEVKEIRRILDGEGLALSSTCDFIVSSADGIEGQKKYLAMAAELGAKYASTVIGDTDEGRAVEALAEFAAAAGDHGMRVAIEFLLMTPGCPTIEKADELIRKSGATNTGILLDVTHFTRSGGTIEGLRAMDTSLVEYVHLADGPAYWPEDKLAEEVLYDRLVPGEGEFPLVDILAAVPRSAILEVEAPTTTAAAEGVSAEDRMARYVGGARSVIAAAYA